MWIFKEDLANAVVAEHVLEKELTNLGRDGRNEVVLDGQSVSRFHASVRTATDHVVVKDLDSENGVLVNGEKINGEAEMQPGDKLQIGEHCLQLTRRAKVKETVQQTLVNDKGKDLKVRLREISFPPDAPAPDDNETVRITAEILTDSKIPMKPYLQSVDDGVAHIISANEFFIGRDVESDLSIKHESVSRKHAKIVWRKNRHFIYDTESSNGCWVNEKKIRGVELASGDFIRLGDKVFQYVDPENPPDPSLKAPKVKKASDSKKIWIAAAAGAVLIIAVVILFLLTQ